MKSFVRHPKTSKGVTEIHGCGFFFKDQNKEAMLCSSGTTNVGKPRKDTRVYYEI